MRKVPSISGLACQIIRSIIWICKQNSNHMDDDTFKRILQFHLQIKAEQKEIIQNVLERKDSMAECYQRASESACVTSPRFGQGTTSYFFLMVICNSLLLLKSIPINIINCIKLYVNCSHFCLNRCLWLTIQICVCLFICKSSPMIHCSNRSFLEVTWQMFQNGCKMTKS